jgi:hypothetical protein
MCVDWLGKELMIREIGEGHVSKWNFANPDKKVQVGDCILEVNGNRGTPRELDKALAQAGQAYSVTMLISSQKPREASALSTMEVCPNMHNIHDSTNAVRAADMHAVGNDMLSAFDIRPRQANNRRCEPELTSHRLPGPDRKVAQTPRNVHEIPGGVSPASMNVLSAFDLGPNSADKSPSESELALHRLPGPDWTITKFPVLPLDLSLSPMEEAQLSDIHGEPVKSESALHRLPSPDLTCSVFPTLANVFPSDLSPVEKRSAVPLDMEAKPCQLWVEPCQREWRLPRLPSIESIH